MIRINRKINSDPPEILVTKGDAETEKLKAEFNSDNLDFKFKPNIYGHKQVKKTIIDLQNNKCCFCESSFNHVSPGDVEHYRPKAGWIQNKEKVNKPGYYWLTYNWDNLFVSCEICNRENKKNFFPLSNPSQRALNHNQNILDEEPLFIHPVNDDPELYIAFIDEIAITINGNARGNVTIEKLGLNRLTLNDDRRKNLEFIKVIYNLALGHPETNQRQAAQEFLINFQTDETEYASMLRSYFLKNPINF